MEVLKITLAAARVNAGYSQDEVARELSVSKSSIVNWEKGRTTPPPLYMKALLDLYKISADNIFLPESTH